jgi:hypothetical protein
MVHAEFFQRYRMLLPAVPDDVLPWSFDEADAQKLCIKLVDECLADGEKHAGKKLDPTADGISKFEKIRRMQHQPIPLSFPKTDVQLGVTKVFMRKPPHDALEAHRVFHQSASATLIQTWVRGLTKRKRFYILLDAVGTVQRCYRGYRGRIRYVLLVYTLLPRCLFRGLSLSYLFFQMERIAKGIRGVASHQSLQNADQQTQVCSSQERCHQIPGRLPRLPGSSFLGSDQDSNFQANAYPQIAFSQA